MTSAARHPIPLVGSFDTVADALEAAALQHAGLVAYVEGAERMSFGEWFDRSDRLAAALVERGVRPGDVVAIMLPPSIDYAVTFAAIELAGAVATGINIRLGPREIAAILAQTQPSLVVLDRGAFAPAVVGQVDAGLVLGRDELAMLRTGCVLGDGRPQRRSSDPAVIIWTSGTTGVPKGAWFDHHGLHAAVASAGVMSEPYDVKLVSTPFAHAGYMAKLWDQLAWGTSAIIPPAPWTATDMLRLLRDERITVAGGVPTQWAKLLEEPGVVDADLSHVRVGLVATAPASPELIERVSATIGCALVVRYAMTESPSITGTEVDDPPAVQFRTVGRPQAGMEVEVRSDAGGVMPTGDVGRIAVRGACVMRGYWNDPEQTASVLAADGWLLSSDLGFLDPEGNLVLVGRSSDMYIRGGYNVYPLEVEHVLTEHPLVDRAAVVGTPAPVIGEVGVAFIVPVDPLRVPSLDELRSWVGDRLADYKSPDRLVVLDTLPLTAMMKVDTTELGRIALGSSRK
ncbi:MAG: hypothetical protein RLZZ623_822 [Actinomycetota bacterium]